MLAQGVGRAPHPALLVLAPGALQPGDVAAVERGDLAALVAERDEHPRELARIDALGPQLGHERLGGGDEPGRRGAAGQRLQRRLAHRAGDEPGAVDRPDDRTPRRPRGGRSPAAGRRSGSPGRRAAPPPPRARARTGRRPRAAARRAAARRGRPPGSGRRPRPPWRRWRDRRRGSGTPSHGAVGGGRQDRPACPRASTSCAAATARSTPGGRSTSTAASPPTGRAAARATRARACRSSSRGPGRWSRPPTRARRRRGSRRSPGREKETLLGL